jgi:hypothetical protein
MDFVQLTEYDIHQITYSYYILIWVHGIKDIASYHIFLFGVHACIIARLILVYLPSARSSIPMATVTKMKIFIEKIVMQPSELANYRR